jgi:hypothetical protein
MWSALLARYLFDSIKLIGNFALKYAQLTELVKTISQSKVQVNRTFATSIF